MATMVHYDAFLKDTDVISHGTLQLVNLLSVLTKKDSGCNNVY